MRFVFLASVTAQMLVAGTQVVMLGTGTPIPDPERSGPCVAVIVDNSAFLFDAGAGVVRRAASAYQKGIGALDPVRLRRVFITHLHSDHTLGLPDLILTPWTGGRSVPLEVWGPKGIQQMTNHILEAWKEDIYIRVHGLEANTETGHQAIVHEVKPGIVFHEGSVTIKAFAVKHGSWPQAFGYRIETPGRVVVISGDTAPTDAILEQCDACDVLIHEVYSSAGLARLGSGAGGYMTHFHTGAAELSLLAAKAKPKLLVLYHQLYVGGTSDQDLLDEVKQNYSGAVVAAHDLDVY